MKKGLIFLSILLLGSQAYTKNDIQRFSIEDVLRSNKVKGALDRSIKLGFGSGATIGLIGGELMVSNKSSSKKSADNSYVRVFLVAMKKFHAKVMRCTR